MIIHPQYLLVYMKKDKQQLRVLSQEALFQWKKENKHKKFMTFSLQQCHISRRDDD